MTQLEENTIFKEFLPSVLMESFRKEQVILICISNPTLNDLNDGVQVLDDFRDSSSVPFGFKQVDMIL